jgi:hypothetical protein
MIRFTEIADDLIKAIGHKYVRRIPKGVTKTGATRYEYIYSVTEGNSTKQALQATPKKNDSFEDIVKDPKKLSQDANSIKKLPLHLYQKNADEIVDAYLAIPRNQERFSNLPNVRQILKTQIAKKQDSNFLDENTARLLRNTVEYHGLIREPATLDSLPFLKEPDVLNKFFDEHPLNVARDLMMREKYSKQFAFENKFEKLVANPKQLSSSIKNMQELPAYLYTQNADLVIDKFLSDPKLGAKFADVPNVRNMLKDQMLSKQGSSVLSEKDFKQLKNTVEYIALRNDDIDFKSPLFSFLLEPSALNNLFDTHALNVARDVAINDRMK